MLHNGVYMKKLFIFSMDSIFNRNLELTINKNEYMLVYPNINNLMLYSYAISNNTNYIIIHSSFLNKNYQYIDMLISMKKYIVIYISNNLEYGFLYNALNSSYFHMMNDKYLSSINEIIPLMEKNTKILCSLETELVELKNKMEEERLVKKAKLLLMKKYSLTEDEAYKLILKRAMDDRVSKMIVAKNIIKEVEK